MCYSLAFDFKYKRLVLFSILDNLNAIVSAITNAHSMQKDPFYQVLKDAEDQVNQLSNHLKFDLQVDSSELREVIAEVEETISDLRESVSVLKYDSSVPREELFTREHKLDELQRQLEAIQHTSVPSFDLPADPIPDQVDVLRQQILEEQDNQLDSIHQTMQNLHLQATTMGEELHDQSFILQDLEGGLNTVRTKISQGSRKLQSIYEENSNSYNDCCITFLIIILLILLFIAFML